MSEGWVNPVAPETIRAAWVAWKRDQQKRERDAARSRAYYWAHRDECNARHRAYGAAHVEEGRAYRAERREQLAANQRSYYLRHRDEQSFRQSHTKVQVAGERITLSGAVPPDLRAALLALRELRLALSTARKDARP